MTLKDCHVQRMNVFKHKQCCTDSELVTTELKKPFWNSMMNHVYFHIKCAAVTYSILKLVYNVHRYYYKTPSFDVTEIRIAQGENKVIAQNRILATKKSEIFAKIKSRLNSTYTFAFSSILITTISSYIFRYAKTNTIPTRTRTSAETIEAFCTSTIFQILFPYIFKRLGNSSPSLKLLFWVHGNINIGFFYSLMDSSNLLDLCESKIIKETKIVTDSVSHSFHEEIRYFHYPTLLCNNVVIAYMSVFHLFTNNENIYYLNTVSGALLGLGVVLSNYMFKNNNVSFDYHLLNTGIFCATIGHKFYVTNKILKQAKKISFDNANAQEINDSDYDPMIQQLDLSITYPCGYYVSSAIVLLITDPTFRSILNAFLQKNLDMLDLFFWLI